MAKPSNAGKSTGRKSMEDDIDRGDRIRELMRTRGHDNSSLARAVGRDRSQIYRWLDGKSMTGEVVGQLAQELETSRTFIMTGSHPEGIYPAAPELEASVGRLSETVGVLADQQTELLSEISSLRSALEDQQSTLARGRRGRGD